MSPLSLRRHRAERLLREQFEALRGRVLASVRRRLAASGVVLDHADLEAAYAQAWQGLYVAVLEGEQVSSPAAWLSLVTHRRALDEHRARTRAHGGGELALQRFPATGARLAPAPGPDVCALERDIAEELDDRVRLRQLFEALRVRLNEREREAASLCYLQGLSRADAAACMQVSERRMRKLMEGRGPGRPGVAAKVGAIVRTISEDAWCEEQRSLMRAFAFGVLDPDGERHALALRHSAQCPACRSYVASLRGLAAILPPVFLPWGLGAGILARAGEGVHASGAHAGAHGAGGTAGGATGAGLQAGRALGGALPASGAAGAGGAAGGGWLLAGGPLGAKLAVGCLVALGVGAGCIALDGAHRAPTRVHRRSLAHSAVRGGVRPTGYQTGDLAAGAGSSPPAAVRAPIAASAALTPARMASREFGPEQALEAGAAGSSAGGDSQAPIARSASSSSRSPGSGPRRTPAGASTAGAGVAPSASLGDSVAAEREFSPG